MEGAHASDNWLALAGSGNGSLLCNKGEREQRLCQRCEGSSVDDVVHVIINCADLEAKQLKHQSLIAHK